MVTAGAQTSTMQHHMPVIWLRFLLLLQISPPLMPTHPSLPPSLLLSRPPFLLMPSPPGTPLRTKTNLMTSNDQTSICQCNLGLTVRILGNWEDKEEDELHKFLRPLCNAPMGLNLFVYPLIKRPPAI